MLTQELSLPVRKNIPEIRNDRTLRLKFSDVPSDEFWICIEEVYKRILKVSIEILLPLCTTVHTCVNRVSHLCYRSETINDPCLKEVDGEYRVALSNIEPNLQRLCSLRQAQITQNNSLSVLFVLVVEVCHKI